MKSRLAVAVALACAALPVHARGGHGDWARVISVTPEYERVSTPREECWTEPSPGYYRYDHSPGRYLGPIIGGVTGGIVGSRIGEGNGQRAATAAGAIIGTIIGGNLQAHRAHAEGPRHVERCRVEDRWEKHFVGYQVVYEYAGRRYATSLPYDPGPRLPVRVFVEPDDDGAVRGRRGD